MFAKFGVTKLDGLTIGHGGSAFVPRDEDSSYAFYERDGRVCGVVYELGKRFHYLRLSPDWQLPKGARDEQAWKRFAFEQDDERAMELRVDFEDGEVTYLYSDTPLEDLDDIANSIDSCVDFLTGLYPAVVDFVAQQVGAA